MDPSCFPHWRGSRISRSTAALPKRRPKWAFPRRAVAKPEGAGKTAERQAALPHHPRYVAHGGRATPARGPGPALNAIEHAVGTLEESRHEPAGLLRINASRTAAKHFIEPHVGEFLARYPRLKLELVMDDGMASIISEGYDAGVRLGESLAEHMVAIPITPQVELVAVATPQYLSRYGTPATPADLVNHNCIAFRHATSGAIYQWEFSTIERHARHTFSVEPQGSVITNDDDGMIRAALQHVGIIQHFDFAVKALVERGELVRILQPWSQPFPGFYLYIPPVSTCLPRSGRCWTFWSRSAQAKPAHAPYRATACAAPPPVWR